MMNAYMDILEWYRVCHRLKETISLESLYSIHPFERDIFVGLILEDQKRAKQQNQQP